MILRTQRVLATMAACLCFLAPAADAAQPQISPGLSHSLALSRDNRVFAWGSDSLGQLGQGRQLQFTSPVVIQGLPPIARISARFQSVAALASDGTVWTWGLYALGRSGAPNERPTRVPGLSAVASVHVGFYEMVALRGNGEAWIWSTGQEPTRVPELDGAVGVSAGQSIVAVMADGRVVQVGGDDTGHLVLPRSGRFATVAGLPPMAHAAAFGFGQWAGIDRTGRVWTWGCWVQSCRDEKAGAARLASGLPGPAASVHLDYASVLVTLADGTLWKSAYWPAGTVALTRYHDYTQVSAVAMEHSVYAILADGTVRASGSNSAGELGRGTIDGLGEQPPARVGTLTNIVSVAAGQYLAFAVRNDGVVFGWGSDYNGSISGQARFGETIPRSVSLPAGVTPARVYAGSRNSYVITATGDVWGFGENIIDGVTRVTVPTPFKVPIDSVTDAAGTDTMVFLRSDGTVWQGAYGGIGQYVGLSNITRVFARREYFAGFALDGSGRLYGFGPDVFDTGIFGEILTTDGRDPAPVVGLPAGVVDFSASYRHAVAAMSDGTVWTWGQNNDGQLGDGTTTSRATPQPVAGLTGVVRVATGACHSLALKSDGTIWAWGCDYLGQLGSGTPGPMRTTPAIVPRVESATQIGAGPYSSYALRSGGLVLAWGNSDAADFSGSSLGDGALVPRSSPVLVSREDALGNADNEDWFLDLDGLAANARPAFTSRAITTRTIASSNPGSQSVATAIIPRAADIGSTAEIFIFARVPAVFLDLVGATPAAGSPAAKALALVPKSGLVLVQLTPTGWSPVTSQLTSFSSGTMNAVNAAQNLLQGTNTTLIPGSRFCIGYGSNLSSMLANGTVTDVLSLPGANTSAEALPCLVAGTYLTGPASSLSPQPAAFTATVIGVEPGGTVSLRSAGATLATASIAAPSGKSVVAATLTATAFAPGRHSLVAAYSGGGLNPASESGPLAHVRRIQAQLALSGPASAVAGAAVTFSVQVSGASPTGNVQFIADGNALGAPVALASGQAQYTTSGLAPGSRRITATYAGDEVNLGGESNALQVAVNAPDTTPDAFQFQPVSGVTRGSVVISSPITVRGINAPATITVDNGTYSAGCNGNFTSAAGSVVNGTEVCVRHVASSTPGGTVTTVLTVGGVSGSFRSTADAAAEGPVAAAPGSLDFGRQSMRTSTPPRSIVLTHTGTSTVQLTGISASAGFDLGHDCGASLAPGASCTATLTFTPQEARAYTGELRLDTPLGATRVPLAGTGERSLVTHYYRAILRRDPDEGGKAFWDSEAARSARLGIDLSETWYAMSLSFFASEEYRGLGRDARGFVTDLYATFFNRQPDAGGLEYWSSLIAQGMPREVVLASFMFSPEFGSFTQAIFGTTSVRAEVNTVVDFYRGTLARLPDDGGFDYWLRRFRAAQCSGPEAVYSEVEAISNAYIDSAEYGLRARSDELFVGDMYNAFLRRGGDLAGALYWIGELRSGARTRADVRRQFIASPEFSNRVAGIISAGCLAQ